MPKVYLYWFFIYGDIDKDLYFNYNLKTLWYRFRKGVKVNILHSGNIKREINGIVSPISIEINENDIENFNRKIEVIKKLRKEQWFIKGDNNLHNKWGI